DPIKKAGVIRDVVESIAKIPDAIKASVFLRECSSLLNMEERILISELNKMKLGKAKKEQSGPPADLFEDGPPPDLFDDKPIQTDLYQEREIIRVLLSYGDKLVTWDEMTDTYIGPYIITNLSDITFTNNIYSQIIKIYQDELEKGNLPTEKFFIQYSDKEIASAVVSIISTPYSLSENW